MTMLRIGVVLTVVNLSLCLVLLAALRPSQAADHATVLRGSALEIVDEQGRIRAEIKVLPADPTVKMPDGTTGYPESVLLRLIDTGHGPNVKLSATEDGAGLVLGGDSGYIQALSRGTHAPVVKVVTHDGTERVLNP